MAVSDKAGTWWRSFTSDAGEELGRVVDDTIMLIEMYNDIERPSRYSSGDPNPGYL